MADRQVRELITKIYQLFYLFWPHLGLDIKILDP